MNTIFDLSEEGRINAINFLSMLGVKFDHDDTYKVVEEAGAIRYFFSCQGNLLI